MTFVISIIAFFLLTLCAHIHIVDMRYRVIYDRDVLMLVGLWFVCVAIKTASKGLGVTAVDVGAKPEHAPIIGSEHDAVNALAYAGEQIVLSVIGAAVVVVALWVLTRFVDWIRKLRHRGVNENDGDAVAALSLSSPSCLGAGDLKLYGACSLYLTGEALFLFLSASAVVGMAMVIFAVVVKRQQTFAFAPAIVWPWLGVVTLHVILQG